MDNQGSEAEQTVRESKEIRQGAGKTGIQGPEGRSERRSGRTMNQGITLES